MVLSAEDLRNAWNVNRGDMSICSSLEIRNRRSLASARVVAVEDLPRWVRAIKRAAASRFCTGLVPTRENQSGFVGTFDWLVKPDTLTLIEEGVFDDRNNEIVPPDSPSPHREDYWGKPRPEIRFSDEEFLRCQIQGRLCLKQERATKRKSMTPATKRRLGITPESDDFCQNWMTYGGPHPWATEAEISEARAYVIAARANGTMPSKFRDFKEALE